MYRFEISLAKSIVIIISANNEIPIPLTIGTNLLKTNNKHNEDA